MFFLYYKITNGRRIKKGVPHAIKKILQKCKIGELACFFILNNEYKILNNVQNYQVGREFYSNMGYVIIECVWEVMETNYKKTEQNWNVIQFSTLANIWP